VAIRVTPPWLLSPTWKNLIVDHMGALSVGSTALEMEHGQWLFDAPNYPMIASPHD
jgi:hypothetical protein